MKPETRDTIWVAILAFVSVVLLSSTIWENGDIELKWWAVKAWANFQFPDFPPNHHNMRWAITFPAVFFIRLFGDGALQYLLLNHLVFALTTAGLYALIRSLTSPLVAALALAVWLINPAVSGLAANLMPEIYSIAYVVAALLALQRAYTTGSRWFFAGAVALMFCAYGAKETNIFFMPGWGLYELMRRRWSNAALIVAVFGALLVVETLAVDTLLSARHIVWGRAQAILQAGHLNEMTEDWIYQPIDLFTRWLFIAPTNLDRLEFYSKALYWLFFIATGWKAWEWFRARTALPPGKSEAPGADIIPVTWAMGLSFAFCTTFFILKLNPLILGQPLNDRYLWPLLAPATIILSVLGHRALLAAQGAQKGPAGAAARLQAFATPFTFGKLALVTLAVIAGFATLTRVPIEMGSVHIRRHGFEKPYTTLTAQRWYDEAREHLMQGCTLAFPRRRPAQTVLVHAIPYRDVSPTLQLYNQELDGLTIAGRRLHGWYIPHQDWPLFEGKLYAELDNPDFFRPYAIRLEGAGECTQIYYLGQADIAPQDQLIEGALQEPPTAAAP